MSIMHPRSWGWDNSINKEIQENHKVSFEKITILNDDIEKKNKTKKRCQSLLIFQTHDPGY